MNNLYLGSRNNINFLKHFKHEKSKNYIINIYTSKSLHEAGVFDMDSVWKTSSEDDRVGKYCACLLPWPQKNYN